MTDLVEHAQPETQVSGGQDASLETAFDSITESPSASETTTAAAPPAPKSLDDELGAIYDKLNGKAPPAAAVKSEPTQAAPVQKAADPTPVADYPANWDAAYKDHWGKLPPEVQKFISEREQKTHQTLDRQGQVIKYFEPISGVLQTMNQLGVQPGTEAQMIQSWMQADRYLSQNPSEALKWLAQQYNVDLAQIAGQPQQPAQQNPIDDLFKDPRYDTLAKQNEALQQKLAALEQQQQKVVGSLTAREQAEAQRQTAYISEQIQKFASDRPYFAQLEDEITHEVNLIKAKEPSLPIDKLLDKAYDRAIYANPQIRERVLADQRKAEMEKAQKEAAVKTAQAKKLSSMNVRTGASASTPTFDGRWDDGDKLSALYDQISTGRR
jgi:hypothetical protein